MKRIIAAVLMLALCLWSPCALAEQSIRVRTPLHSATDAELSNIQLAADSISGFGVPYGYSFSFNSAVGPRSAEWGYEPAPNGRGIEVIGGGVAQCATTMYLALRELRADVEYIDFHVYGESFARDYVSDGSEAIAVDYANGLDFIFTNYEADMYIEMWTSGSYLYCSITLDRSIPDHVQSSWRRPAASASIWIDGSDSLFSNILHAASSINDTVLGSGDLFSFNETVGPRSEAYGYEMAINGRGAEVMGGGVAQVASVIWLAVKNLDDVAIVEKSTYGSRYNQEYVSSSNDAILTDYASGADFSFRYTGDGALMISTYVSGDTLCCEIYRT